MVVLAIALGVVLPIMVIYYLIKDVKEEWEKEKRQREAFKAHKESMKALKKSQEK